jgi:hypothetical protein
MEIEASIRAMKESREELENSYQSGDADKISQARMKYDKCKEIVRSCRVSECCTEKPI